MFSFPIQSILTNSFFLSANLVLAIPQYGYGCTSVTTVTSLSLVSSTVTVFETACGSSASDSSAGGIPTSTVSSPESTSTPISGASTPYLPSSTESLSLVSVGISSEQDSTTTLTQTETQTQSTGIQPSPSTSEIPSSTSGETSGAATSTSSSAEVRDIPAEGILNPRKAFDLE